MRAKTSSPDPAANVTTMVTGRVGHAWACAGGEIKPSATNAAAPTARCKNLPRGSFMALPFSMPGAISSIRLDVGSLDDRRPARDLALDQRAQRLLAASRLVRNVVGELAQAFARGVVVERLVERVGELVEDRLGGRLGVEHGIPRGRP